MSADRALVEKFPQIDLIIVATVTPDMAFPSTAVIRADHPEAGC